MRRQQKQISTLCLFMCLTNEIQHQNRIISKLVNLAKLNVKKKKIAIVD